MARVTDAEVKEIITTEIDTTPHINNANTFVTEQLGSSGLSSAVLKMIELYVSAHLVGITIGEGNIKNKRIGESQKTYGTPIDMNGLKLTKYGETALILDTSGTLSSSGKKKAKFFVL